MDKQFYFLSPVEVVKVTTQNLQEVAEWCGGKVATTESRRVQGRMDSYVWVPTPKNTAISWAFPGMFITKRLVKTVKGELKVTYAVFRRDYFEKNYFNTPTEAVEQTWEKGMATKNTPQVAPKPQAPKKKPAEFLSNHEKTQNKPASTLENPVVANVEIEETSEGIAAVEIKADGSNFEEQTNAVAEEIQVMSGPIDPPLTVVTETGDEYEIDEVKVVEQAALQAIADSAPEEVALHEKGVEIGSTFPGNDPVEHGTDSGGGLSPREIHQEQVDKVTTTVDENGGRELVPDHELRAMGLIPSYAEGYKPVYRDEIPTDVEITE